MWGKLVDLAAAAAEQVQKEAINIANDGFDLLDKLDNTMNNTEGQEDEERMKIDASSDLVDREISKGEVGTSTLARSELLSSPLETRDEKTSPISLPIKPPAPDSPKKSPVKRGTFSPLAKISSPPKPQEVDDPASYRALADLKSVLWCSPSASMEEVLERVKEVLHENGEQAEVIRGLSESLDAKESAHRLEIAELKEHLVQSNGRLSVLEASLDEKEKRAQEQASSSLNQIASLQRELSSALDQVAALEAGVADSHSKWLREEAALLTKCETLSSEKEKMATDLRTKESELRSMLEKLEGSDLSIVSLNARVEALVLELRSLEQNRSAMEQEHARQLEASTEANSTLTQKLAEARKQLKGKVAGKNTYTDEINKLKSELAEANERVSALERLKLEESASFLAQISALVEVRDAYEQSIAELRQQVQEKSSALEDMSASRASPAAAPEVPRTPERATRHAQITGPDSPDDSSFKTPGPAPKSSLGKGKQRPNGKSKAEVTDEIKTLSSQLHSLKAMQATLSSDVKQSMALINQDLVSSITASLVPQISTASASAGTAEEKTDQISTENLNDKNAEISQLEQRIGDYEHRINALISEMDELSRSLESVNKELTEANIRAQDVIISNTDLQESLRKSDATIVDLKAAQVSLEASLQSKIAALSASVETLMGEFDVMQSNISKKDSEILSLSEKLSISEKESAEKISQCQALELKNEELTARIFFLDTLAKEVAEKNSLVVALQKEIKALQDGAADLEMNQAELEQKINEKSHRISDLESKKAHLEEQLQESKRKHFEDLQVRDVEASRLNELITESANVMHLLDLERQKSLALSQKCMGFEEMAVTNSELQRSLDECNRRILGFETEIGKLHGKLSEAAEMIERLKETNDFQQFELSAKVKHIGDLESLISKMKQALEDSSAKLFSLQDDIARRVLEETAIRDKSEIMQKQIGVLMRERDDYRKASEEAESQSTKLAKALGDLQNVTESTASKMASAEQQLEFMIKEVERKDIELGQLSKRIKEMQEVSSSISDLKAELDRANEKLSKQDEKKKRDLENLKKQNELIAKVNREKDELERNLNRTIAELNVQLTDLKALKLNLELALQDSETARAAANVEADELRMKLSLIEDSSRTSSTADENRLPSCECAALKEALDASNKAMEKEGELHLLTRKSLEQENVSIRDQLSSRDHTVRELQGQLSELEKERDALLVAQSTASGLGLQLQEVQGRNRDLQMELDKASIKAKQQDLALSDANSSVIRLRTELSSVSKQLSELKAADMSTAVPPSVDIEAGSFLSGDVTLRNPHGASSFSTRSKGAGTPASVMLTADADDLKGKDDWDGVNPYLLQVWAFLRQRAPSLVPERPPSRKLVTVCVQLYLIVLHGVAVLSISYIKQSCKS